ncbi:hypothetical protein SHELI_v1c04700 [Spiroplasma helicoides]|uniref:Uncharacterized protein n=1 Tax=Spiroplasma helicoides TaxID=216938 RepID=A0A1B3SKG3_9MOLU|nr:hypothetical protein [Spiroplasma helicoides]AOG60421.1 hypothetical protein SHELI_v1c04700 [Spiroplasma helicoides]
MENIVKKEDTILNKLKSRLVQTDKKTLVFFNSFKENSMSIDLLKACNSSVASKKGFDFTKTNYEFKIVENINETKDSNKILKNQFSKISKKNTLILQEKNIHSLLNWEKQILQF